MKKHYRRENDCLNCGAVLQGKFCHVCGQENLEMRESFGHMLNHAVSDYFHFDHQFFHTLKPLLFQPGKLTQEYIAGRRMQYLHPVKMYIFISLVYFVLLFKTNHEVVVVNKNTGKTIATKESVQPLSNSSFAPVSITEDKEDELDTRDTTYAQYLVRQGKLPVNKRDDWFERFFKKTKIAYTQKYGKNWFEMFQEDLRHNIPKMMFILLPLFALILKLAFSKNKKYYVEHLIYAIHLHCFYFLCWAALLLLEMILPNSWAIVISVLTFALFIYTNWYIYHSLRNFYQRSRWRTISKMVGVLLMYLIFFSIGITTLVFITAATA